MLIAGLACVAALAVVALLSVGPLARSTGWNATVTPLASIIGSGFLICGPLLAREFGAAALPAMAALLALAYAVGWVVRFNIVHIENHTATLTFNDPFAWAMRIGQFLLAVAYSVSVAYYLKLLAEFVLVSVPFAGRRSRARRQHPGHRDRRGADAADLLRQSQAHRARPVTPPWRSRSASSRAC